jgi:hypothetical protein
MRLHSAQRLTGNIAGLYEPPDEIVGWAAPISTASFDMRFEALICGDPRATTMQIGSLPWTVASKLGWRARGIFLSPSDVRKLRFHEHHGMSKSELRSILRTIEYGDYYKRPRGGDLQIEVVLHSPEGQRGIYYLALARDREDEGIFLRTYFLSTDLGRNKMKAAETLFKQSNCNYFR